MKIRISDLLGAMFLVGGLIAYKADPAIFCPLAFALVVVLGLWHVSRVDFDVEFRHYWLKWLLLGGAVFVLLVCALVQFPFPRRIRIEPRRYLQRFPAGVSVPRSSSLDPSPFPLAFVTNARNIVDLVTKSN